MRVYPFSGVPTEARKALYGLSLPSTLQTDKQVQKEGSGMVQQRGPQLTSSSPARVTKLQAKGNATAIILKTRGTGL